jgi:hypothetical protein
MILCMCFAQQATAQSTYEMGSQNLHIGIGIGSTLYGSGFRGLIPPVSISYEKAIKENIGVGGYIGYATSRYDYTGFDYHWRYTYMILGARGAYHFADKLFDNEKLDTYAGLMLGYNVATAKFKSDDPLINGDSFKSEPGGGFAWSFYVGGRYQIKESFGLFAELGYGIAWLQAGVNLKLGEK